MTTTLAKTNNCIMKTTFIALTMMIAITAMAQDEIRMETYTYAVKGQDTLKLDVYTCPSARPSNKQLAYVYSFGGGWETGTRADANMMQKFARQGYVAISGTSVALNMDTSVSNVALPGSNVALNMDTSDANVALPEVNVALPKRYTKEQLHEKMKEICTDWITVEEIAINLGRNTKYVKNHVIPQMANVLEKMYDVPHHPRQKYRVNRKD